ncbi:MAG: uroporphyrinogen decarboxylase family protein [Candidatus Thorarchaeota archaeon]
MIKLEQLPTECHEYMTPMERITNVLLRKKVDRIPCFPFVSAAAAQIRRLNYGEYASKPELFLRCQVEAQQLFGYDGITAMPDLCVEAQAFGAKIIYPPDNAAYPDPYNPIIKSADEYKNVGKLFDWSHADRMKDQIQVVKTIREQLPDVMIGGMTIGPLGLLSRLRNANDFVRDFVHNKEKLHEACEIITEIQIEYVEKQIEAGARTIMVPVVLAERELMSKEMWLELDMPYQKKIADFVKKKRCFYLLHTCGRDPYFDLIIEHLKPVIIQNAFLPDGVKTEEEMVEKYGKKLIFLGFLSVSLLAWGNPMEVISECKRQLDVFGKTPAGYILGASCEYPPYAPLYNAMAVVKAARIYGKNYKSGYGPNYEEEGGKKND